MKILVGFLLVLSSCGQSSSNLGKQSRIKPSPQTLTWYQQNPMAENGKLGATLFYNRSLENKLIGSYQIFQTQVNSNPNGNSTSTSYINFHQIVSTLEVQKQNQNSLKILINIKDILNQDSILKFESDEIQTIFFGNSIAHFELAVRKVKDQQNSFYLGLGSYNPKSLRKNSFENLILQFYKVSFNEKDEIRFEIALQAFNNKILPQEAQNNQYYFFNDDLFLKNINWGSF